ncbi:endospore germination permease [Metallumcola ferriviriculae]|uniref:Endospore germination permease n=1 Tax=Metallumcola ferriviriculae TaxID=3039180 RepID=A0AAU0UR82_9FIRM|nr:endospore germination permease [Desulfitibacteraceae bacterium MK1]
MIEKGRIGNWQLFLIVLFIILPTAILSVPGVTTVLAKQDGWIAVLLATAAGTTMAVVIGMYYKYFPQQSLVGVGEIALGRWLGKLVGIGYIWFILHANSIIIREFGEFLTTAVMPRTPLSVFNISVVILAAWAVYQGLEPIGRMAEFIFPLVMPATLVVVVLVFRDAEPMRLLPVAHQNVKGILAGSMVPASWMGEVVLVALITPYVYQQRRSILWVVAGVIVVGLFLAVITMNATMVFGFQNTRHLLFPTYSLARIISIGNIIERVESLVMAIWVAGVFLKIAIWFYMLVLVTGETFALRSYKPLIIPYGFVQIALSFWLFNNFMEFISFIGTTWPVYSIGIFELGIPVIVLLIALVRRKVRGDNAQA